MKVKLEIDDECVDKIILAALHRTIKCANNKKFSGLFPDRAEITAACKLLIEYYGIPPK